MMKSVTIFLSFSLLLFLSSCKKDAPIIAPVKYTGNVLVNFNNYSDADGNGGYTKVETTLTNSYQDVNVEVKLTNTTEGAPNDIYVYLIKVDALVTDYNAKHGTNLSPIGNAEAALQYDFSKPVIIKKGEKRATISMKVNPVKFDLSKQNAIGIAILKVEGAAVNNDVQSKLVIEFGARNKYDGHYRVTGTMTDAANSALTGFQPYECDLETLSDNAVVLNPTDGPFAYAYAYPINNNGTASAYGSFTPVFTFNTTTDKVLTVTNYYGQPAPANGRSAELNPAGVNQFSASRTLQVSYWMNQPSVIAGHRTTIVETFTYIRAR